MTDSDFMQPLPRSVLPSSGRNSHGSSPRLPSPGFDDNDLKKAPGFATQTSYDSDYQTGENLSMMLTESSISQSRYVNMTQNNSDHVEVNGSMQSRSQPGPGNVYQNLTPDQPPAVPARDDGQPPMQPYVNIANRSSPQASDTVSQPPPIPPKFR